MNNETNIFDFNNCITQNAMLLYLNKKLNTKETRAIEEHLCNCELCSDAIDGLYQLNETEQINLLNNIKNPFVEKKPLKVSFIKKNKWTLAASITLLLGIGGFAYNKLNIENSSNKIADSKIEIKNQEVQPTNIVQLDDIKSKKEKIENKEDSKAEKNNSTSKESIKFSPPKISNKTENNITKREEKTARIAEPIVKEILPKANTENTKPSIAQYKNIAKNEESNKNITSQNQYLKDVKNKSNAIKNVYPAPAQNNNYTADNNNIITNLNKTTNEHSDEDIKEDKTVTTFFDNGIKFYNRKKYAKALRIFNNNNDVTKKEAAQYYAALCNFYLDNFEIAKSQLEKIIKENGKYSQEAKQFYTANILSKK